MFVAGLTGLISLVGIGLNQGMAAAARIMADTSLELVHFSYPGRVILLNNGEEDVFVSDAELEAAPHSANRSVDISLVAERGKVVMATYPVNGSTGWWILRNPVNESDAPIDDATINRAINTPGCLRRYFYSEKAPSLRLYRDNLGDRLVARSASARVTYRNIRGTEARTLELPLLSVFALNPECEFAAELTPRDTVTSNNPERDAPE